jgi:hypothetical protein
MKLIFALLITLSTTTVFARQYIQCSHKDPQYTDVMVVNLTSVKGGTLFLSSGMQNPDDERLLVNIELDKITLGQHFYRVTSGGIDGVVSIPATNIGKPSHSFFINLIFNGYEVDFSCFSRLYEDT